MVLLPAPIPPWGLRVKARNEANSGEKGRQRQTAQEKGQNQRQRLIETGAVGGTSYTEGWVGAWRNKGRCKTLRQGREKHRKTERHTETDFYSY